MSTQTIKVDYLARVEGEGGLLIKVKDDKVTDVKFKIFEPPRFFEAFLAGAATSKRRTSPRASAASVRLPTR
jgi:sulfhydrogenase subunit alpha